MSEQSAGPSLISVIRPSVILTAIAIAFYLLVVWNPIGTYGDVRSYLEDRIRVPLEWMVVFFAVSWFMQRNTGYAAAGMFLVPIFVLILTLTSEDYGMWFWRIFQQEIYLPPVYVPRGFLMFGFLLGCVLFDQIQGKEGNYDLLISLVIAFVLTSNQTIFTKTLSPPISVGVRDLNVEQWRETARGVWEIIAQRIDQHVPTGWRNTAKIAASLYPFFALVLLLFPGYRTLPKDLVRENGEEIRIFLFFVMLLGLSAWAFLEKEQSFLLGLLGIPAVLQALFLILTSVLWVPLVLFLLPAFVFSAVSLPFKLAYFLVIYGVKAPVMAWHYLHYLLVPHPAETAYTEGRARDLPTPEIAARVADKLYQFDFKDYDDLPPAWVSKNQKRRINEFQGLVEADDAFMESVIKNLHLKDQLQTEELLEELWQNHLKKSHKNQSRAKS